MIVSFLSPSTPYPIGGVAVIFEFANALSRRGHQVQILHHGVFGRAVEGLDDIAWFDFHPGVIHQFTGLDDPDDDAIPSADVFFGYAPADRLKERYGLPVVLIQGYGMLGRELEAYAFEAPCPKVCVAKWLIDVGVQEFGSSEHQFVHIPPGLDHDRFTLVHPIESRARRVAMLHHDHITKGSRVGRAALELVHQRLADVEFVAFGTKDRPESLPEWVAYHRAPSAEFLAAEIYNQASIFLCPSHLEGFGLPSIEAMACGAALVTTSNGGSRDYATHDETALVAERGDAAALADHVERLLSDDATRIRLATAGERYVARYTWAATGDLLERFLNDYVADPGRWSSDEGERAAFGSRSRTNYL